MKKKKKKKYHTVGTVIKFNRKIVERNKIDTHDIQIPVHVRSLSWLGSGTSITSSWVKIDLWVHIYPLLVK